MAEVIIQQLSLMIRLIDTTTGNLVYEKDVIFRQDGKQIRLQQHRSGFWILLNGERKNCILQVSVYGYEDMEFTVDYEQLEPNLPVKEVYLLPEENRTSENGPKTLQGVLTGISSLMAVPLMMNDCFAREYDERKRIISLLNPHHRRFDHKYYGIVPPSQDSFEMVEIDEQLNPTAIRLKDKLHRQLETNSAVVRIVYGQVGADGHYLLRVADNADKLVYMVRYTVEDRELYQILDFRNVRQLTAEEMERE